MVVSNVCLVRKVKKWWPENALILTNVHLKTEAAKDNVSILMDLIVALVILVSK